MNRLMSTLLLSAALTGAGCTTTGKNTDPDTSASNSGTSRGSKFTQGATQGATVGALSGAALGGGIGLLVGSSSGHAGEGLAVGALAGGVAGAGVGAAVGDYRSKQTARKDSITDQEIQLREQKRDFNSVKDSLGDEVSSRNRTGPGAVVSGSTPAHFSNTSGMTSAGGTGYGVMEGYRGNPHAKAYRPEHGAGAIPASVMSGRSVTPVNGHMQPVAWNAQQNARSAESRGRMVDTIAHPNALHTAVLRPASQKSSVLPKNTFAPVSSDKIRPAAKVGKADTFQPQMDEEGTLGAVDEPPVRTVGAAKGTERVAARVAAATADLPDPASAVKAGSLPAAKSVAALKSGTENATSSITSGAAETAGSSTVVAKQLGKVPTDANASCIQAEKEAARATNATSDADRLFYLGRASRLCPTSDTYQVELGKVFSKIGKTQEAKNAYKKAAELNPQNDAARDELSILENSAQ